MSTYLEASTTVNSVEAQRKGRQRRFDRCVHTLQSLVLLRRAVSEKFQSRTTGTPVVTCPNYFQIPIRVTNR
jgi:hypothetical protein